MKVYKVTIHTPFVGEKRVEYLSIPNDEDITDIRYRNIIFNLRCEVAIAAWQLHKDTYPEYHEFFQETSFTIEDFTKEYYEKGCIIPL